MTGGGIAGYTSIGDMSPATSSFVHSINYQGPLNGTNYYYIGIFNIPTLWVFAPIKH